MKFQVELLRVSTAASAVHPLRRFTVNRIRSEKEYLMSHSYCFYRVYDINEARSTAATRILSTTGSVRSVVSAVLYLGTFL